MSDAKLLMVMSAFGLGILYRKATDDCGLIQNFIFIVVGYLYGTKSIL